MGVRFPSPALSDHAPPRRHHHRPRGRRHRQRGQLEPAGRRRRRRRDPRAAGPELLAECRLLGGCDTGDAKITGAGRLPVSHVIHAVGPVWRGGESGEPELLASCYRRAIELAAENGCRRVAFPAISAGIYGYPLEQAARVALDATAEALERHPEVVEARFWLFDQRAYDAFSDAL